jgi:hypothetical protein
MLPKKELFPLVAAPPPAPIFKLIFPETENPVPVKN